MVGQSGYCMQIEDKVDCKGNQRFLSKTFSASDITHSTCSQQGDTSQGKKKSWYKKILYQADGTPRYFGGKIYQPTQALL